MTISRNLCIGLEYKYIVFRHKESIERAHGRKLDE